MRAYAWGGDDHADKANSLNAERAFRQLQEWPECSGTAHTVWSGPEHVA